MQMGAFNVRKIEKKAISFDIDGSWHMVSVKER